LFPIHLSAVVTAGKRQITVISPAPCGSGCFYRLYDFINKTAYSPAKAFPLWCNQSIWIIAGKTHTGFLSYNDTMFKRTCFFKPVFYRSSEETNIQNHGPEIKFFYKISYKHLINSTY